MGAVVKMKQADDDGISQSDAWLAAFLDHGDAQLAVKQSGYNCSNDNSLRVTANRLKKRHAQAILDATRDNIAQYAPVAIKVLCDLAQNSEQDSVKATAAKALAAYSGLDIQRTESITTDTRTDSQLLSALADLASNDSTFAGQLANIGNGKASNSSQ